MRLRTIANPACMSAMLKVGRQIAILGKWWTRKLRHASGNCARQVLNGFRADLSCEFYPLTQR